MLQDLIVVQPEMIGIGTQETGRVGGAWKLVRISRLERRDVGWLYPKRSRDIGKVEAKCLSPPPQHRARQTWTILLYRTSGRFIHKGEFETLEEPHQLTRIFNQFNQK